MTTKDPNTDLMSDKITILRAYYEQLVAIAKAAEDHFASKDELYPKEKALRAALFAIKPRTQTS